MAKKVEEKQLNYDEQLADLKKRFSIDNTENAPYISSGSLAFDLALDREGRGFRCGRVVEYKAWEGSGKTTICLHTIAEAQKSGFKCVYVDAEHSLNREYAEKIGVNWEEFEKSLFQPANGEEAFEYAKALIKTDEVRLLVFDSTSGMLPKKQMEGEAGDSSLGLHARLFSSEVPKIKHLASKYNCLVIFISQIREKIGVMFGSPETTQAGNALKFFADYRIDLKKQIMKENGDKEDATGITTKFNTIKNKAFRPYVSGDFYIKLGVGIDKIRELIEILTDLDIIYKWGSKVKLNKGTDLEIEYTSDEFTSLLQDNEEFFQEMRNKVLEAIKQK